MISEKQLSFQTEITTLLNQLNYKEACQVAQQQLQIMSNQKEILTVSQLSFCVKAGCKANDFMFLHGKILPLIKVYIASQKRFSVKQQGQLIYMLVKVSGKVGLQDDQKTSLEKFSTLIKELKPSKNSSTYYVDVTVAMYFIKAVCEFCCARHFGFSDQEEFSDTKAKYKLYLQAEDLFLKSAAQQLPQIACKKLSLRLQQSLLTSFQCYQSPEQLKKVIESLSVENQACTALTCPLSPKQHTHMNPLHQSEIILQLANIQLSLNQYQEVKQRAKSFENLLTSTHPQERYKNLPVYFNFQLLKALVLTESESTQQQAKDIYQDILTRLKDQDKSLVGNLKVFFVAQSVLKLLQFDDMDHTDYSHKNLIELLKQVLQEFQLMISSCQSKTCQNVLPIKVFSVLIINDDLKTRELLQIVKQVLIPILNTISEASIKQLKDKQVAQIMKKIFKYACVNSPNSKAEQILVRVLEVQSTCSEENRLSYGLRYGMIEQLASKMQGPNIELLEQSIQCMKQAQQSYKQDYTTLVWKFGYLVTCQILIVLNDNQQSVVQSEDLLKEWIIQVQLTIDSYDKISGEGDFATEPKAIINFTQALLYIKIKDMNSAMQFAQVASDTKQRLNKVDDYYLAMTMLHGQMRLAQEDNKENKIFPPDKVALLISMLNALTRVEQSGLASGNIDKLRLKQLLAQALLDSYKKTEALELIERVLKEIETGDIYKYAYWLHLKGKAYLSLNKHDQALSCFKESLVNCQLNSQEIIIDTSETSKISKLDNLAEVIQKDIIYVSNKKDLYINKNKDRKKSSKDGADDINCSSPIQIDTLDLSRQNGPKYSKLMIHDRSLSKEDRPRSLSGGKRNKGQNTMKASLFDEDSQTGHQKDGQINIRNAKYDDFGLI